MSDILNQYMPNLIYMFPEFLESIGQTLLMVLVCGFISLVFGIVFGLILVVTREGDILENKIVYTVLGKIIDLFRAIPFIILVMILSDVTKFVSGTSIGLRGSFFPDDPLLRPADRTGDRRSGPRPDRGERGDGAHPAADHVPCLSA